MRHWIKLVCCLFASVWPMTSVLAINATDIRFAPGVEEVVFRGDTPLAIKKHFLLASPPRLVVDLSRIPQGHGVGLSAEYRGSMIANIRFGQFDAETSRIVLDLATPPRRYDLIAEGAQLRLTLFGNQPTTATAPLTVEPPAPPQTAPQIAGRPVDFPLPEPKPLLQAKQALKPVIVIDAGHGGKDSGALGNRGTIEKEVTLRYARALRQALLRTGRYRVVMTRDSDRYLFLSERVNVARKQDGDAFISIHADSNPRGDARGLSVYTLSEQASDAEAAALAAQENKADIIGGLDLSTSDEAVASILIDLAQRETNNKSARLAETLIVRIDPTIPLITNPHRHAGFRVLKAPDIPSILVEIGFLSNGDDERRVNSPEYERRVIQSLIRALDAFFE